MKISTRSRYGLKALIEVAVSSEDCISLKTISQNIGISENYLEQLMTSLKKDKIVGAIRGSKGGYILLKEPTEITIGDILRNLEKSELAPVNCVSSGGSSKHSCGDVCNCECLAKDVWDKIYQDFNEIINNITLQNVIDNNY